MRVPRPDASSATARPCGRRHDSRFTIHDSPAALRRAVLILLGALTFLLPAPPLAAQPPPEPAPARAKVSPADLDRALREVLNRREFAWRLPREIRPDQSKVEQGAIAKFFGRVHQWIRKAIRTVSDWWDDFQQWLRKLGPKRSARDDGSPSSDGGFGGWLGALGSAEGLLWLLLIAAVGAAAWVGWRQWQQRRGVTRAQPAAAAGPAATVEDLQEGATLATDQPEDEWMRLARELAVRGEYRLALRARFLAVLSRLGREGVVAVTRAKSNRDYLVELRRRAAARGKPWWPEAFAACIALVEGPWYGEHPATAATLAAFAAEQDRFDALRPAEPSPAVLPPALPA